jgi:hypothetical protein
LIADLGNEEAIGAGFGFANGLDLDCSSSDSDSSSLDGSSGSAATGFPANWRVRTGCAVSFFDFGGGMAFVAAVVAL